MRIDLIHIENAERAKQIYLDSVDVTAAIADWRFAVREARWLAMEALRASNYLQDVETALVKDGSHALVFRQILAPPLSQDQFKLVCPEYSKTAEKTGRPFNAGMARVVAETITARIDRGVAGWPSRSSMPNRREVETFLRVASTLIGSQQLATARRKRMAIEQEGAVAELLVADGWTRLPSRLIDTRAMVQPKHFMQKTRFATATATPQEVDIACGLNGSYVLAMECKVTNDETNSVKRINDVLKKAAAWRTHWGSFVETAAMLQGVIAAKDVQRLSDANIHVFWSHDLRTFKEWIAKR